MSSELSENYEYEAFDPHTLKSLNNDLKRKVGFLKSLVAMGEEPYEIEFEVKKAAEYCSMRAMSLLPEHGYQTDRLELLKIVELFFEFVYLCDHGSRRYTIETVPKRLIEEFRELIHFEAPLEKVSADDFDFYDMLKYIYFALEASGLETSFHTQISHINLLHKRALKAIGFKGSKSLKRKKSAAGARLSLVS